MGTQIIIVCIASEVEDNRTKAIITMHTPSGAFGWVMDRSEMRDDIEEGMYEYNGLPFSIEFCEESEVDDKLGKDTKMLTELEVLMMMNVGME